MIRALVLAWLLAGCADPVLAPVEAALTHYDAGRAALEAGDPARARVSFAAARAAQPDAPSLLVWEAHAAREAGDGAEAQRLLTQGLARWPGHPELRVHRAALHVLNGDLASGASDLRAAYATGRVHPADLAADLDFVGLAEHEAYRALVPPPAVTLEVRGEAGAVLLGERWAAELRMVGPQDAPLALALAGPLPEQLSLEAVVEDRIQINAAERTETRTVALRFRAVAEGEGFLGPFEAAAGPAVGQAPPVPVSVLAVPGRAPGVASAVRTVPLPSQFGSLDPSPGLLRTEASVVLTAPPGAKVALVSPEGEPLPAVRLELREAGSTRLVRHWLPAGTGGHATITQGGLTLLDEGLP